MRRASSASAGGTLLGSYVEREVLGSPAPERAEWLEMLSVLDTITAARPPNACSARRRGRRDLLVAVRRAARSWSPVRTARTDSTAWSARQLLNRLRRTDPTTAPRRPGRPPATSPRKPFDTVAMVRACQELGQVEGAVELVRRTVGEAMRTGRWAAGLVTLELLPVSVRRAHPDLSLVEARALLNLGRSREATEAAEVGPAFTAAEPTTSRSRSRRSSNWP